MYPRLCKSLRHRSIVFGQNSKDRQQKEPLDCLPFVKGLFWIYLLTSCFHPNCSFYDTTPLTRPTPLLRRPSRKAVLLSMSCMSLNSSSGMTFDPNALITSTSWRRAASNRCQLSLTRSSWPCMSRLFNSVNIGGNGGLSTPDKEGKTLDMSPEVLFGCAEVEVATNRFGIRGKTKSATLAWVHF